MRVILDLDDRDFLLSQLSKLYEELPPHLRSRKSIIPASELICEAIEYLSYLKQFGNVVKETDTNWEKEEGGRRNDEIVYGTKVCTSQKSSFAEKSSGTSSVSHYLPSRQNPSFDVVPNSSLHYGPCSQLCKCNKMLLEMTQNFMNYCQFPNDRLHVTNRNIYSAAIAFLFHQKTNKELFSLLSILKKKSSETECWTVERTNDGAITFGAGSMYEKIVYLHDLFYKSVKNIQMRDVDILYSTENCMFNYRKHLSQICINPYHYKENDYFQYIGILMSSSSINHPKEMTFWRREIVQREFFAVLLKILGETNIKRFTQAVQGSLQERASCFSVIKSDSSELVGPLGQIKVRNCLAYIQHVLFKMFRNTLDPLGLIIIGSSKSCKTSFGTFSTETLCLNPWHYERLMSESPINKSTSFSHFCTPRLVINLNVVKTRCYYCNRIMEMCEEEEDSLLVIDDELDIKDEVIDVNAEEEIQRTEEIQRMEEEIQRTEEEMKRTEEEEMKRREEEEMKRREEEEMKREEEEMKREEEEMKRTEKEMKRTEEGIKRTEEEIKTSNEIKISNDVSFSRLRKRKTLKRNESYDYPVVKHVPSIVRKRSTRVRKVQKVFQCWKCQKDFQTNTELENHKCWQMKYSCLSCGLRAKDVQQLKTHTEHECPEEHKKKSVIIKGGEDGGGNGFCDDVSSESSQNKCHNCSILFANYRELVLHQKRTKCKSIQCGICNKFYANVASHQDHSCLQN